MSKFSLHFIGIQILIFYVFDTCSSMPNKELLSSPSIHNPSYPFLRNFKRTKREWQKKNKRNAFIVNDPDGSPIMVLNKRIQEQPLMLNSLPESEQQSSYDMYKLEPVTGPNQQLQLVKPAINADDWGNMKMSPLSLIKARAVSTNQASTKHFRRVKNVAKSSKPVTWKAVHRAAPSEKREVITATPFSTSSPQHTHIGRTNEPFQAIFSLLSELKQMISLIHEPTEISSTKFETSTTQEQLNLLTTAAQNRFYQVIPPSLLSSLSDKRSKIRQNKLDFPRLNNVDLNCYNDSESVNSNITKETNTSKMIEQILEDVEALKIQQNENLAKEGLLCNISGSWSSSAGGMLLNITQYGAGLNITIQPKSPPGKKGFLLNPNWTLTGILPSPKTSLLIVTGINEKDKHVTTFIGECRCCSGTDTIVGSWLLGRVSRDCKDQKASQELLTDVWCREMLTELRKHRLESIKNQTTPKRNASAD